MISPSRDSKCKHYLSSNIKGEAGFCNLPRKFRCEEAMKYYNPTMTQSALKSYMQCPYKYHLHYNLGVKRKDEHLPEPIKAGILWDTWMTGDVSTLPALVERYQVDWRLESKLRALVKAFQELEIEQRRGDTQCKVQAILGEYVVTGTVDDAHENYFNEDKLGGRPEFYHELSNIHMQCGTYFLSNPAWDFVDIRAVRLPQLKTGWGKYGDETSRDYRDRIFGDICKRPSYYFPGYNKSNKAFGRRFWRSEFDLDFVRSTYRKVFQMLRYTTDNNLWVRNELACYVPTQCMYIDIKKTGVVSEELFDYEDKDKAREGML
jgi:hypothetical protein